MNYQKTNFNKKKHSIYKPVNMKKFLGKEYPICRSSWERAICRWLDLNNSVKKWDSESIIIPYQDPSNQIIKGKIKQRRYYPDFYVEVKTKNGIEKWVLEIKPYKETIPPKKSTRKSTKTLLYEAKTWKTNLAKWKAAKKFCNRRGWKFKILTEKDLF